MLVPVAQPFFDDLASVPTAGAMTNHRPIVTTVAVS
jgi:hypothetical protein